jgi:hypothetical protein
MERCLYGPGQEGIPQGSACWRPDHSRFRTLQSWDIHWENSEIIVKSYTPVIIYSPLLALWHDLAVGFPLYPSPPCGVTWFWQATGNQVNLGVARWLICGTQDMRRQPVESSGDSRDFCGLRHQLFAEPLETWKHITQHQPSKPIYTNEFRITSDFPILVDSQGIVTIM